MVTQQLLDYIKQQLQKGQTKENIRNTLITSGWNIKDVEDALTADNSSNVPGTFKSKHIFKIPVLILIVALLFIVVGGSIYAYNALLKSKHKNNTITPQKNQQPTSSRENVKLIGFIQPKPPYSLVISGEIKDGYLDIKVDPFFFVTSVGGSSNEKKASSEAQFKILLKKKGSTFFEDNFDTLGCLEERSDYCSKLNHSFGYFVDGMNGIPELPDEIVIQHLGKDIRSLKEPNDLFPTLSLINQEYKNGFINISWNKSNKKLNYLAYVSNNNFQASDFSSPKKTMTITENSLNDKGTKVFSDNSFTFMPKGFMEGDLQVAIYATDGFRTYVAYSGKFKIPKTQVQAKIELPKNGETYYQNNVPLEADSFDPRSGMTCGGCADEGNTFTWTSSLDGVTSHNHDTYCQFFSPGNHKITLLVKNKNGTEASASVNITVSSVGTASAEETKLRQQAGETCYK